MKKVNFITSLSPQKQYEINCWFWVTIFLSVCAISVSAYFFVPQVMCYVSLHKQCVALREKTENYAEVIKNKNTFNKEYDVLRARETKINKYVTKAKNPYDYIATIVQVCGNNIQLESVRFIKKECEITIECQTAEQAYLCVKCINESNKFNHCKITSLMHNMEKKLYKATIKGYIIY